MGEPKVRLSPKQKQVCRLVAAGLTSKQIAIELGISHRTVDAHREAAYRRLHVRNAVELVNKLHAIGGVS